MLIFLLTMIYVLIAIRKPITRMGLEEFIMDIIKEIAIIPKGTRVSIMGCRITIAEDTKVEANQANLDHILNEQSKFDNGIGIVGEIPSSQH